MINDESNNETIKHTKDSIKQYINNLKEKLNNNNINQIIDRINEKHESISVKDMIDSNCIPIFNRNNHRNSIIPRHNSIAYKNNKISYLNNNDLLLNSNLLNYYKQIERNLMDEPITKEKVNSNTDNSNKAISVKKKHPYEQILLPIDSTVKAKEKTPYSMMLSQANSYIEKANNLTIDSNHYFYLSGYLYNKLNLYDKAIHCFNHIISNTNDCNKVIDYYDISTNSIEFNRKLQFTSKYKKNDIVLQYNNKIKQFLTLENERQRLYKLLSYVYIIRLYLYTYNIANITTYVTNLFKYITRDSHNYKQELNEILNVLHNLLKEFSLKNHYTHNVLLSKRILSDNTDIITDSHINVLLQLYDTDKSNTEVLEWLGIRYAEKCNFEKSKYFYKCLRDAKNPIKSSEELLDQVVYDLPINSNFYHTSKLLSKPLQPLNKIKLKDNLSRFPIQHMTWDEDIDNKTVNERKDFIGFLGKHYSSNTVVYIAPSQGWDKSAIDEKNILNNMK